MFNRIRVSTSLFLLLMVFCLLYVPCTATIVTINREVGSKKITFGIIMFQLVTAWVVSFIAYHIAGLVL